MVRIARLVLALAVVLVHGEAAAAATAPAPSPPEVVLQLRRAHEAARRLAEPDAARPATVPAHSPVVPQDARWANDFGAPAFDRPPRTGIEFEGDLVVGGDFTRIGHVYCPGVMLWNGSAWEPMGEGPGGMVFGFAVVSGTLVAAGSFYDPVSGVYIALKRWNGDAWVPFGPHLSGIAYAVLVDGTTVYVTGHLFSSGYGTRVVRLDGNVWTALGGLVQGNPLALAVWNGLLVLGGQFESIGGVPMRGLASWDGSAWSEFGGGLTGNTYDGVYALTSWQGGLVAGGYFSQIGGQPIATVARWTGASWTVLGAPLDGGATAVLADGATLHVAGNLYTLPTFSSHTVLSTDGVDWSAMADEPLYSVSALVKVQGGLAALGPFYAIAEAGVQRPAFYVARRAAATWQPLEAWSPAFEGFMGYYGPRLAALETYQGHLLVGGPVFARASQSTWGAFAGIGTWDGTAWSDLGDVTVTSDPSFAVHDGTLDAFGVSDWPRLNAVSRFDGSTWQPLGEFSSWGQLDLAMYAERLHAVGYMGFPGGTDQGYHVAQWDGVAWNVVDPGFFTAGGGPAYLRTMVVHAGRLYVAGDFERVGATYASGLAAWDGTTWSAVGGGVRDVTTMLSHDGLLWVGGVFFSAGGVEAYGLASWNGSEWSEAGLDGGSTGVYALGTYDGALVAGGYTLVSGPNRFAGLAVRDRGGWHGFGSGIEGLVYDVQQIGSSLYVAGDFATAGGKPSYGLARWDGGVPDRPPAPAQLALASRNPFASSIQFAFTMTAPGDVLLTIHDLAGREVGRPLDGALGGGPQTARWSPAGVEPGIYVARLVAAGAESAAKIVYLP